MLKASPNLKSPAPLKHHSSRRSSRSPAAKSPAPMTSLLKPPASRRSSRSPVPRHSPLKSPGPKSISASLSLSQEEFENAFSVQEGGRTECESPDADAGAPQVEQLQGAAWNFCVANSNEPFKRVSDQVFVMLTYVLGTENFFYFPMLYFSYGGVLFLIPHIICVVLIAVPVLFLESAVGQYTSLPPLLMFQHLGPAFTGIGWMMTMVICLKGLVFSFRPVRLLYALQPFLEWMSATWKVRGCTFQESSGSCYDPLIQCSNASGVYQLEGQCYGAVQVWNNVTWNDTVRIMASTSKPLRKVASEIYLDEFLLKEGEHPLTLVLASSALQDAVVAIIATYGIRTFVKVSRLLVILPIFSVIFLSLYSMTLIGVDRAMESINAVLEPNWEKLLTRETFFIAASHVMFALNVTDGSMITISAMKKFKNNFFRDIAIVVVVDTAVSLLSCFFTPPIVGYFADVIYSDPEVATGIDFFGDDWNRLLIETSATIYGFSPVGQFIFATAFFCNFLVTIGVKYVAYETLVMSICHLFPQLARFDQRISRPFLCSIIFFASFVFSYFASSSRSTPMYHLHKNLYLMAPPFIGLAEMLIMVHCYKLQRFAANIRTMIGSSASKLWKSVGPAFGVYWYVTWVVLTPCCLVAVLLYNVVVSFAAFAEDSCGAVALLVLLALTLLAFAVQLLLGFYNGAAFTALFTAQQGWGPARYEDRVQARFDERAAHVV